MDDEYIRELMTDYEIDHDTAERAAKLVELGLDEDEAVDLADSL